MDDAGLTRRRVSPWRVVGAVLASLALIAAAAPAVLRLGGWEDGPLAYVVALCPWVVVACAVPLVLGLFARAWLVVALSLVVALLAAWWMVPLYVGASGAQGDTDLTVATANLLTGRGDAEAVVAMVRDRQVDVLSLQELTPEAAEALVAAGLEEALPYAAALPDAQWDGTGLWSRYPITEWEGLEGYTFRQVNAVIELPDGPTTVLALHPAAPQFEDNRLWADETARMVEVLDAIEGPVIVAGDLNLTRDHLAFRDLEARGFADAADQVGAGHVPTFPEGRTLPVLVALDHVVTRGVDLVATSAVSVTVPGADHRALVVTYAAD